MVPNRHPNVTKMLPERAKGEPKDFYGSDVNKPTRKPHVRKEDVNKHTIKHRSKTWGKSPLNVGGPTLRDTPDVRSNDFKRGGHVEIFFSGGLALRAPPPPSSDSSPL